MNAAETFWARAQGPLRYGVNDCATTVADVIKAAGGPDLMEGLRGRYRTALGFVRMARREGHSSAADLARAVLARHGEAVTGGWRDLDAGVCVYVEDGKARDAVSVRLGGYWLVRTDRGGAAFADGVREAWRIHA